MRGTVHFFVIFLSSAFVIFSPWLIDLRHAEAATSGKMVLYFHKEPSDTNETYNALTLTPPEPAAYTSSALTSVVNTNATPATAFCESSNNTGETFNKVGADAGTVGNRCIGTFISSPVGQAITLSTADASAISAAIWSSESAAAVTAAVNIYLYRWNGTGLTVNATDRIATFTGVDPGTVATLSTFAAAAPANNITFAATDRIVAIVSMNVTALSAGTSVSVYTDNSAVTNSQITLKYTTITPNKPTLSGTLDDDFALGAATTACTSGGVTYNTKWTCLLGTAASVAGALNNGNAAGTIGDSTQWLWLRNQTTVTTAVPSNFGTTPSNTFLYQPLPASYGDGIVRTVINSPLTYTLGPTSPTTPFNHSGLVLWTSNTNYIEVQVYSDAAKGVANTAKVALNNCTSACTGNNGTLTTVNINSIVSNGLYNRVWVGFQNTGGSYQAQYSTDGTTWNNVGAPIAHAAFARVGLNAYTRVGNPIQSYTGAFEWFQYTFAPPPAPTSYTNNTEAGLNFTAGCSGCGARIGGGAGFRQSITITGTNFGADPGVGNRSSATNNVTVGTHRIVDANVTSWSATSITLLTDTVASGDADSDWGTNFGGASALTVTAGGQTSTGLNFYVFPQVTSLTQPVGFPADSAREYNAADTDGVITLNGTRFGTAQGTGYVRILGCDVSTCSSPSSSVTINSWGNTAIQVQVPPVIASNAYTGSIVMQQGTGANGTTHTYANTFRILPRITGFTPVSGAVGDSVTVNGDHFCQNAGVCPGAFSASNKVTFTSGIAATIFTSWSDTAMATQVPASAATGNVVLTSNSFNSNGKSFTVLSPTPSDPTLLNQFQDSALTQAIATGGMESTTPMYLTMSMQSAVSGGTLYPQIEYKAIGTGFACTGSGACGSAIEGTGVAGPGPVNCNIVGNACAISISPADNVYHWQARVRHNKSGTDYYSNWISFPLPVPNAESATDFNVDSTPPAISNISSGTPGTNAATITWDTLTEQSTSQVQYNTTGTFVTNCATNNDCTTLNITLVTSHSVGLSNLNSGTTYYYRVRSKDAAGNETISANNTFTTATVNQPAKTVRFHVMSLETVVNGGLATSTTFLVHMPELGTTTQSMFVDIHALYNTSGVSPNGVTVQVNSETAKTYALPTGTAIIGPLRILHQVSAVALDPSTNTLTITPDTNTSLNSLSADLYVTYSYTP